MVRTRHVEPWDEAVALVFGALGLDLGGDDRLLDANLTLAEREKLIELIRRRCEDNIPTPYLLRGFPWPDL